MADDRGSFDLEVGVFPLQRLVFASQTHYQNGTLGINRAALLNAIAEPRVIADIEIHLAHPGESCRIVHVLDAVPVMAKVEGRSTVFPGFFGPAIPAGDGRNHRLRGAAMVVCGTFPDPTSGALSPAEVIIDMSGPTAPYCAFSDTANVVLVCHPAPRITNAEFDAALHRAKLKAAVYLARATASIEPPELERYHLSAVDPALPRVVYVNLLHQQGLMAQTFLYAMPTQGLEPTVLHPNEMLDGALVNGNYRAPGRGITAAHCDNSVVRELYRRHGDGSEFFGRGGRPRLARYAIPQRTSRLDDGAGGLPDGGAGRHRVGRYERHGRQQHDRLHANHQSLRAHGLTDSGNAPGIGQSRWHGSHPGRLCA